MIPLTVKEIKNICGVPCADQQDVIITGITPDSRQVREGHLFAAIKGERTDGHRYILSARDKGASAVLCEELPQEDPGIPVIAVPSTIEALQKIAAHIRKNLKIPVIGIGGSVGKTSTKECVASVVAQKYKVHKTKGNFNNELGLPLTIFDIEPYHEAAVLEMGISDFGEMHLLASIARPDICILTNIGDCHLENLKDRNGVLKAKSEMFDFLDKDGHVLLNGDDGHLRTIKEVNGVRPLFFGLSPSNDIKARDIRSEGIYGSRCEICMPGARFSVLVPKPGQHMILNALAAAGAGMIMGLSPDEIKKGIEEQESVRGRFHITKKNGLTVIDDCYNANPMSMEASLKALSETDGRKVAVLGDMGELGENEASFHEEVGRIASDLGIDVLCCAGELSVHMAEAAARAGNIKVRSFKDRDSLTAEIKDIVEDGDNILVKASHFMGFDKVVEKLLQD